MSVTRIIEETKVRGKRLGRHVNHDVRSLGFLYEVPENVTISSVTWEHEIAILDQGDLGSCTGNSITGCLGTKPLFESLPPGHPALDETEAVKLYSEATVLDGYPGSYPPDDTGSDGVSAAQAAKNDGLISGYTHCLDLNTMLAALMSGPVMVGLNWYSSFDTPAADGTVTITKNAYVRGGHEPMANGVDAENEMILFINSWGAGWGDNGTFKMSYDTMTRLLSEQGDVTVPLPLSQPAPTPKPVLYVTNGTESLLDVSKSKGSPVSTIFRTTLQQFEAFTSGMSKYMQAGDMTAPLPEGETLCLAWPIHHFA
jgi:Papain family cysteine protease